MSDFVNKASQKINKLSKEQLTQILNDINNQNSTFDSIFESLSIGLIIVTDQFKIYRKNKTAHRFLPCKNRNGKNLFVWETIEDAEISEWLKTVLTGKKVNVSNEFSVVLNDKVNFINISVLPLVQKTQFENLQGINIDFLGYIITLDNTTEKRQREILAHRMEKLTSLTNLAGTVAHEIKNPLGAISIQVQLLQKVIKKCREGDGLLPEPKFLEHNLDIITEEIENLNKIAVDFLFATRPVKSVLELLSPDVLLEKIAEFITPDFEDNGIKVTSNLNSDKVRVMLDQKLFKEIIINLVQNAKAAIISKKEKLEDTFSEYNGEVVISSFLKNQKYYLTIADNGCGMDSNVSSHIFEPYYTTKADGTGLGLTTVYKIVKEFNGDINVQSQEGKGTFFTISLPVPQKSNMLLES